MVRSERKLLALVVVTMLVFPTVMSASAAATTVGNAGNRPITVHQGGECYTPTALGNGSESVASFYDYSVYTNYSSTGTSHLQENQVSNLFLYNGSKGYSLVFLHDEHGDNASYASTITANITGLPEAGSWPVEDDSYPAQDDNFTHDGSRSEIDWMWAPGRTDGAAFRGLGTTENLSITIRPRFNERAAEWGDWAWSGDDNNRITRWRLLGDNGSEVATLDMTQNVTVGFGTCNRTAPTASLSADKANVTVGTSVTFDASDSTDDEEIVQYRWDYDGDGTVDARTDTPTTAHAYANASEYTVTVTVADEAGNTDSASVTVDVTEDVDTKAPSAALTAPNQTVVGTTITLNASNSTDDEGIVAYRWDYDGDGTIDARTGTPTTTHAYANASEYTATVTVADGANNTDFATATINVTAAPDTEAPSAVLDTPTQTVVGETVTLNASNSTDNEGIVQYRWDYDGDGTVDRRTSTATVSTNYSEQGSASPTVIVADDANNTDSATATLNVTEATDTEPPTATLDAPAQVIVGTAITLDASNSTDNEGVVAYRWDYDGDGTVDNETTFATATHVYANASVYTATVTVADDANNTDSANATVNVTADTDTEPPTATLNAPAQTIAGTTVSLDASNSTDNEEIVQYRWDVDGDGTVDQRTTSATATARYNRTGDVSPTVTVVDRANNTDSATATVNVTEDTDTESPTASLNVPTTAVAGTSVTLDASNSTDNEGIVSYRWDYDGDGTIDTRTGDPTTTHAYANASEYAVTVIVVDEANNTDSANTTLNVTEAADTETPVATLDAPAQTVVGAPVTLDASNSTDNEEIGQYRWDYNGDGTVDARTDTPTTAHAYANASEYTVTVTVADGANNTDSATAAINVTEDTDTQPPTATLRAPGEVTADEAFTLNANNSTDNEGIVGYRWDYDGDGTIDNTTASATTTVSLETPSEYTPTVTVVDAADNEASANVSVTVKSADTEPPTATLNAPSQVTVGETFTVEAVNVTDASTVTRSRWYYDGTEGANGTSMTLSFAEPGEHTVSLELRDSAGNDRTITRTVSVIADESDQQETDDDESTDQSDSTEGSDSTGGSDSSDQSHSDGSTSGPSNSGGQRTTSPPPPSTTPDDTDSDDESETTGETDTVAPSLSVTSVRVNNQTVRPGDPVTVTVVVANTGNATGSYTAALRVAGGALNESDTAHRDNVTVPAGENRTLTLATAFDQPGEYDVRAGNRTRVVTVNETTENPQTDPPADSPTETPEGTPVETPPPTETSPTPTEPPVITPGPTPPDVSGGTATATPPDSTESVPTERGENDTTTTTMTTTENQTPGRGNPGLGSLGVVVATVLGVAVLARYRKSVG